MAKPRRPRSTLDCTLHKPAFNSVYMYLLSFYLYGGGKRATSVRHLRWQAAWLLRVANWWEAKG